MEIRRVKQAKAKTVAAKTEAQIIQEIENFNKKKSEVRDKQLFLLELIKQRISIEKLKERNIQFLNRTIMGDEINLTDAMAHSSE